MSRSQDLYFRAPVAVQNALVTAYGYHRARKRYGREFDAIRAEIDETRRLTAPQKDAWAVVRLRQVLAHAASSVPYYRRLFSVSRFDPTTLRSSGDLRRLPIMSKADVRAHGAALRTEGAEPFWTTETSGSTGTPLTITLDSYAYRLSMALLARHEGDHGITLADRRATFAGRLVQPVADDRPPFWRYNWAERQMLCSAYHMSDRNLPGYLDALARFQPAEIIGYPSAIYTLADFCRRSGRRPAFAPRAVVTNSETLFDWQRAAIERYLGAPVFDYYGTAESVVFAPQCERLNYHPDPLMGVAEVLDEHGNDVQPGDTGRLVCTTTSNRHMPLVRYDIGDTVVPLGGPCPCGLPGAAWSTVIGRTDDVVITPKGRAVGRLDHVFKGAHGVRECQIVQTALDRLVLRVVPADGYGPDVEATLVRNTGERVGPGVAVSVERVEAIPRTSRGKFKGVVREFTISTEEARSQP